MFADGEPAGADDAGANDGAKSREMTTPPRRLVSAEKRPEDETSLRPQVLADFTGQEAARKNLKVFIEFGEVARRGARSRPVRRAARPRQDDARADRRARARGQFPLDLRPVIAKAGDLAAQLTNLEPRDVLFIDEISPAQSGDRGNPLSAMEDFQLDLIIGAGPAARSVKIDLSPFTLVGATTRAGLLTTPLRDRFGIPVGSTSTPFPSSRSSFGAARA